MEIKITYDDIITKLECHNSDCKNNNDAKCNLKYIVIERTGTCHDFTRREENE